MHIVEDEIAKAEAEADLAMAVMVLGNERGISPIKNANRSASVAQDSDVRPGILLR